MTESITMFLPLLLLLGIFALIAFIVVAILKKPDNPNLIEASTVEKILLTLLGFFMPVIGIILFFVWRNSRPELAIPIANGLKVYIGIFVIYLILFLVFGLLMN